MKNDDNQHEQTASEPQPAEHTSDSPEAMNGSDANDQSVAPVVAPVNDADVSPKPVAASAPATVRAAHSARKRRLLTVLALVVVAALLGTAYVAGRHTNHQATPVATAHTSVTKPKAAVKTTPTTVQFVDSYLASPQLLAPQPNFFSDYSSVSNDCDPTTNPCKLTYSKIGTTKDGKPIIIVTNDQRGEANQVFVALQTSVGHYSILGNYGGINNQGADYQATFQKALDPSTTLDTTTKLSDISFDQNVTFKGTPLTSSSDGYASTGYPMPTGITDIRGGYYGAIDSSKITKLGNYGAQSIYQVTAESGANYKVQELYLTINQDYAEPYYLDSPINNTKNPPDILWSGGGYNSDEFTYHPVGCGSFGGYLIAQGITSDELTVTGTDPSGNTLYSLPTDSALFQEIYNDDYASGAQEQDDSLKNLTADQFQAKHGIFLEKDGLGEYVVYENESLILGGGCGKPVVYLYPTHTESVNVSVGATINKSTPLYPLGGWKNVLAQPNGQLSYDGQNYPSLYWEGAGYGEYPVIDSGTVVASKDAVSTIKRQLSEQGLKPSEISDFLAYWQPRLPHTSYVRLTWFNTAQMNALAPLTITPKPTTTIRVFLDFQGLNRKIAIPSQHFSAPARTGFTAVEWGGLDRSLGS